jgi:hypothetical protein
MTYLQSRHSKSVARRQQMSISPSVGRSVHFAARFGGWSIATPSPWDFLVNSLLSLGWGELIRAEFFALVMSSPSYFDRKSCVGSASAGMLRDHGKRRLSPPDLLF